MKTEPKSFAIIPGDDELASVEREIGFHDSVVTSPKLLDSADIERWNQDGYLGPLPVLGADHAKDVRHYFDDLLEQTIKDGGDSYSISSAHMRFGPVYDLLTHPTIVGYVADLLGENVVGWGSHFFCKMPRDGKHVDWHQDCSYWPLTPTKSVTVWLAIDDADVENGCMEVILGSHRFGLIGFEKSSDESGNVLNQTISEPLKYGVAKQTPIPAGSISIHSDLLVHGSPANLSDRRRCGLTLRYCPAEVTAHLGWNQKGVCVRGTVDSNQWPGRERPE